MFFTFSSLTALSISEKRDQLTGSPKHEKEKHNTFKMNGDLAENKLELNRLYREVQEYTKENAHLFQNESVDESLNQYIKKIANLKKQILFQEEKYKQNSNDSSHEHEGIWHQPETTLGQLVIDYGSCDYIYLVPPEISILKIHVSSELSVPKACWSDMLESVLAQYGVGVKQISPFLRQLYFVRLNQSSLHTITDNKDELQFIPDMARICFVLQPKSCELKRIYVFLEKFSPLEQMNVQIVGNSIIVVGFAKEVRELLKIYDFIAQPKHSQEYRLITLQKAQSEEMSKILYSIFEGDTGSLGSSAPQADRGDEGGSYYTSDASFGFRVIPLKESSQSLFLLGNQTQLEKACRVIQEIEERIGEAQEKSLYWYSCKHSEADELASVLSQVYEKMIDSPSAFSLKEKIVVKDANAQGDQNRRPKHNSHLLVTPPPKVGIDEGGEKRPLHSHENFIVDQKTNSIVMVVESFVLPKLKDLLKKLDVPKRMVQIDILLFEKRVTDNNSFGLNLLRMGQAASHKHRRSAIWNEGGFQDHSKRKQKKRHHKDKNGGENEEVRFDPVGGILQFLVSRKKHGGIPAFDIAYNFLMTQEDIQINANPSVTTVNQTPTKISVVEQMSINTGVLEVDTTKTTRFKDSYSREEYGITIQVTPTIHAKIDQEEDPDATKSVTLATEILFDTTRPSKDNRPDVTRRNIKNEVRVEDGQTVILGGLRRKIASDMEETIPFLGEIPGIGKLFSVTSYGDSTTEMFIFLTPRILPEKNEEYKIMRQKELLKRPGDLPEFLEEVLQAQKQEKRRLFERGLKLVFDRFKDEMQVNPAM